MTPMLLAAIYALLSGLAFQGRTESPLPAAYWTASVAGLTLFAWRLSCRLCPRVSLSVRLLQTGLGALAICGAWISWAGWAGHATLPLQLLFVGVLAILACGRAFEQDRQSLTFQVLPAATGVALFCLLAFAIVTLNAFRYTPVGSDDMWYHLPMVAEWTRSGHTSPVSAVPLIARAYPGFRESVMVFLSLPFQKEHLAIPGVLEALLFSGGVYVMLRWGFARTPLLSATAALYALTAPQVSAAISGNDLALGVGVLLALVFGKLALDASAVDAPTWRGHALYAGIGLGLTAATKYSGPFLAGLAAMCLGLWAMHSPNQRGLRQWSLLALIAVPIFILATPWYLRNVWLFDNPLYPAPLSIFGVSLFRGPLDLTAGGTMTLGWNIAPLIDTRRYFIDAFGPCLPVLLLAAVVGALQRPWRVPVLLVGVLGTFVLFLHQPFSMPSSGYDYNMRYLLPWFACVLLAAVAWLSGFASTLAACVLLLGSAHNLAELTRWWPFVVGCAGTAFVATWIVRRQTGPTVALPATGFRSLRAPTSIGAFGLLLFPLVIGLDRQKEILQYSQEYGYRDLPSSRGWGQLAGFVHEHLSGARMLITGDNRFFPFYGNHFTNQITLMLDASAEDINAAVDALEIDFVICLNPIAARGRTGQYAFGASTGQGLLTRFPQRYAVRSTSDGAFVLAVRRP